MKANNALKSSVLHSNSKTIISFQRFSSSNDSSTSTKDENTSLKASLNWKKNQLDTISNKFQEEDDVNVINNDEELQTAWKQMESRVTKRKLPPKFNEGGAKTGRRNIRKSEEDEWLKAALYDGK